MNEGAEEFEDINPFQDLEVKTLRIEPPPSTRRFAIIEGGEVYECEESVWMQSILPIIHVHKK